VSTSLFGDAVGRRLDFLIQEINREVNTLGIKRGSDTIISMTVVEMKAELEKLREQVQNVELKGDLFMSPQFVNIGFGNTVVSRRVIAIISPERCPHKTTP